MKNAIRRVLKSGYIVLIACPSSVQQGRKPTYSTDSFSGDPGDLSSTRRPYVVNSPTSGPFVSSRYFRFFKMLTSKYLYGHSLKIFRHFGVVPAPFCIRLHSECVRYRICPSQQGTVKNLLFTCLQVRRLIPLVKYYC